MNTEDTKIYEEWLTTIANTRLVYNTMDELEEFLDNRSIHSNGIRRCFSTPQKLRSAFRDLKEETSAMTEGFVNLEKLMILYKKAWEFYRDNLARRSSPRQMALELLCYVFGHGRYENLSRKKKEIFNAVVDQDINYCFLVLMLLKIIPGYDSKDGDVVDMPNKYEQAMELMEEFVRGVEDFNLMPVISNARSEKHKSRLMLLYHLSRILNTCEAYYDSENLYATSTDIKDSVVELDIAGYWNECGGTLDYTDFWTFEPCFNKGTYFATRWHKGADNRLTGIRYTFFLIQDSGKLVAYILHPEAISRKMQGLQYGDRDNVWYTTDMPDDDAPDRLFFTRVITSSVWQLELKLTRVTDRKVKECYDRWFDTCEICNPFKHLEYEFYHMLHAVTSDYLYIDSENEGEYYRVPRNAREGFEHIKLTDNVGLMTMDGKIYLAFDELLLYIPATNRELKKYGIERVREIE